MISCLFKVSVVKCIEFLCRRRPRRRQRGQRRGEQGAAPRRPHPIPSVPDITEGTEKRSCLPFAASSSPSLSLLLLSAPSLFPLSFLSLSLSFLSFWEKNPLLKKASGAAGLVVSALSPSSAAAMAAAEVSQAGTPARPTPAEAEAAGVAAGAAPAASRSVCR